MRSRAAKADPPEPDHGSRGVYEHAAALLGRTCGPERPRAGDPVATLRAMAESGEVCVYCATSVLVGGEKPEHAVPASLGASLAVNTVCDVCNAWAGREVDQPFLDDLLVRELRSLVDQRDPRRVRPRRVRSALLTGHTDEGDRITFDHEQGRPVMGSRIVDLGDGRSQIRAGSQEEADRLLEKMRKRAAAEGKEVMIEEVERGQARPEIKSVVSMRPIVWRREVAKIALAVGSIVYPAEWRLSDDAVRLREWMLGEDRTTPDGKAPALVPETVEHPIAQGDEHFIWLARLGDGTTYLVLMLFGRALAMAPIDTTGADVPQQAWRLDWRAPRKNGETTFEELVTAAVLAMQAPGD